MSFGSNPTVPKNSYQGRMHEQYHRALAPSSGELHSATGRVLLVFDSETIVALTENGELKAPEPFKSEIENAPGLLFALVATPSGKVYCLPFKETLDTILSTYGNSIQIEGRNVNIEYTNLDIQNGRLTLQRNHSQPQIDSLQATNTLDIGFLVI
jgi:hypothetical protein